MNKKINERMNKKKQSAVLNTSSVSEQSFEPTKQSLVKARSFSNFPLGNKKKRLLELKILRNQRCSETESFWHHVKWFLVPRNVVPRIPLGNKKKINKTIKHKNLQNIVLLFLLIISIAYVISNPRYISYVVMSIETDGYKISVNNISKELKVDELIHETISIYNAKDNVITLSFFLDGDISQLVEFDKEKMIIEADSTDNITLRFFGNRELLQENTTESVFKGNLIILGDINKKIPLSLTLYNKKRELVEVFLIEISSLRKSVNIGSKFKYKLDLHNLLSDMSYDVILTYSINKIGAKGNEDYLSRYNLTEERTVRMEKSFSLLEEIPIPKDFEVGDYSLNVKARYLNFTSTISTMFSIKKPFYMYKLLGKIPIWVIFIAITFFILVFLTYRIIKKVIEKKKRFHAKVEYNLLPQETGRSLFVGHIAERNKDAYIDMDKLTTHTIIAGSTGSGKSIAAQVIIEECLMKNCSVLVFDPTAQWSGMLRKCEDKKFLKLYSEFGMNKKDAKAFNGNITVIEDVNEDIDLTKYMKPGEIHIFAVNRLKSMDYDTFVANTIKKIFHSNLKEARQLNVLFVYDEIHRILKKFGGSGEGFIQIERACREFRKWGIGLMLISQVLADFVGQIKANINTEIQMKTRDDGDLERIKMKYGIDYIQALVKAPVGSGMIQNSAWNKGIPYYITFRPILHSKMRLKDKELDQYAKYNRIVDDIECQFEQLKEFKQDVFDLELELKLAKGKIKTGNFNIVQIYLDGLTPKVQKIWDKIGKEPKKIKAGNITTEGIKETKEDK